MVKKVRAFHRLNINDREEISRGLSRDESIHGIARKLNRSPSAILREINKSCKRISSYRAEKAQTITDRLAKSHRKQHKLLTSTKLRSYVHAKLMNQWSPDEISKRLKLDFPQDLSMRVSAETIYTYLFCLPKGELRSSLITHLRQEKKSRRPRAGKNDKRGCIHGLISIDERPKAVAKRIVPGHWEGDLIIGKGHQSAIGTLVERVTRLTLIVKLKAQDATTVRKAFEKKLEQLPKKLRLTLTYDRGGEMKEHELFTKHTKIQVYFAHPYHSWERGTNENTNGLIRQYFPKGTDFSTITGHQLRRVQNLLNNRPRKVLDYYTPNEVFREYLRH